MTPWPPRVTCEACRAALTRAHLAGVHFLTEEGAPSTYTTHKRAMAWLNRQE